MAVDPEQLMGEDKGGDGEGGLPRKPRYDLSPGEVQQLEAELVTMAAEHQFEPGLVAVWIHPDSPYADLIRTGEASYFQEVTDVSDELEANTTFFGILDTRPEAGRVIHGTTITGLSLDGSLVDSEDGTGFYSIDTLIELGNFTKDEFSEYFEARGIDLSRCVSIEGNFRIGERSEDYLGFKPSDFAYLTVYQRFVKRGIEVDGAVMFGSMNQDSRDSFTRKGIDSEPLMGREDFVTEESLLGKNDFKPAILPYNQTNKDLFDAMSFELPQLTV